MGQDIGQNSHGLGAAENRTVISEQCYVTFDMGGVKSHKKTGECGQRRGNIILKDAIC